MLRVQDLLAAKGDGYFWVASDATVFAALGVMARHDVGAVLVLEGDQLVGILSERDYARQVVLRGRTSRDTKVASIMSTNVICVGPYDTIDECMALITEHRVRHLPVLSSNRLEGVVSIGDVVKAIMRQQESTIQQLEGYIAGVG